MQMDQLKELVEILISSSLKSAKFFRNRSKMQHPPNLNPEHSSRNTEG